jgi:hypothetical protein
LNASSPPGEIGLVIFYHQQDVLDECPLPGRKLNLNNLPIDPRFRDNKYAESRGLYYLATTHDLPDAPFIGMYQASYTRKFQALDPPTCYPPPCSPVVTDRWLDQADAVHPGMKPVLIQICKAAGIEAVRRPGPLCNSMTLSRRQWEAFLPLWLRLWDAAQPHMDRPAFANPLKPGLEAAYLGERLTTAAVAYLDFDIQHMTTRTGERYYPIG